MMNKRFAVNLTAAATLGAFGPAFAQSSSTTVDPNVGVNADVGVTANPSSTDTSTSSTIDPDASSTQSSGGSASGGTAASSATGASTSSAGKDTDEAGNRYQQPDDKKTGLDRADQAAGEHGQQGRDNARMHQSR